MKNKLIWIFVFSCLILNSAWAAKLQSIDLEVDYINSAGNIFIKKTNYGVETLVITGFIDEKKDTLKTKTRKYSSLKNFFEINQLEEKDLIPISSLKEVSYDQLKEQLGVIELETQAIKVHDKKSRYRVNYIGNGFFLKRTEALKGSPAKWELSDGSSETYIRSAYPIHFNKKYTVLLYANGIWPFETEALIPLKKGYFFKGVPTILKKPNKDLASIVRLESRIIYDSYIETFEKKGKKGLRDLPKQMTIEAKYDWIKYFRLPFIVAYQADQKKIDIYRRNGELLKLPHLQAVHIHKLGLISLVSNHTIYWLDPKGQLTLEQPELEYSFRCGMEVVSTFSLVKKKKYYYLALNSTMLGGGDKLDAEPRDLEKLFAEAPFKKVSFLNMGEEISGTVEDERYANFIIKGGSPKILIVETQDGKFGIIQANSSKKSGYKYLLGPGNYKITSKGYYEPIKIEKDGLIGWWPLNPEPQYIQAEEFDKGISKVTLPNQKTGWLNLNGELYLP